MGGLEFRRFSSYPPLEEERKNLVALNIKDPETDRLARELAKATGETVTDAVKHAVEERLMRLPQKGKRSLAEELMEIGRHCAAAPEFDPRSADEILGYDENGLPT
jgi:antitoxin VapB